MSSGKVQYLHKPARVILETAKELDYDNFRLSPNDDDNKETSNVRYCKLVWITKKAPRTDEQRKKTIYKKPPKPETDNKEELREWSFEPDNLEVEVDPEDEYGFENCTFSKVVTFSPLKLPTSKDSDKKGDSKGDKIMKDASIAICALDVKEIMGGDYSPTFTDDMTDEQKAAEEKKTQDLCSVFAINTTELAETLVAVDKAWRKFATKICVLGMFGLKKSTKVFSGVQYNTVKPDKKDPKKSITIEFERPLARIKFPIHNHNSDRNGNSPISKMYHNHIGRFFKKKDGDKFEHCLFDGKKFDSVKGEARELRYRSVDPVTGKKKAEPITIHNMSKAVTAKSLIGGFVRLFEFTISSFGLAPKWSGSIFVRRHKKVAKFGNLDAEAAQGMNDFGGASDDSDDEYETPDNNKSKKKESAKKKTADILKKRKDDSDDSDASDTSDASDASDDDKPSKKSKGKKKESAKKQKGKKTPKDDSDASDGSDDDEPPKKASSKKKKHDTDDDDGDDSDDKPAKNKGKKSASTSASASTSVSTSKKNKNKGKKEPNSGSDTENSDSDTPIKDIPADQPAKDTNINVETNGNDSNAADNKNDETNNDISDTTAEITAASKKDKSKSSKKEKTKEKTKGKYGGKKKPEPKAASSDEDSDDD
jgi:hypothetical protein